MGKLNRILDALSYWTGYIAGGVILAIMSLTMIEVVTRYVLHRPLILSDEFGGYSLVIIAFLGFAYTWKERGHIRITFAVSR
ncbi:MAG: TRAP transporter small permease subunit, partial [Chloroflexota bacterium]|nr:TRAP transporter small permease subunit [Chloroflexota bacterium]